MTQLAVRLNLDDKNYKDTKKLTWLADDASEKLVPIIAQQFTSLITVPNVPKVLPAPVLRFTQFSFHFSQDGDLSKFVNYNSRFQTEFLGASSLASLKLGDILQIHRKGFFVVDQVESIDHSLSLGLIVTLRHTTSSFRSLSSSFRFLMATTKAR